MGKAGVSGRKIGGRRNPLFLHRFQPSHKEGKHPMGGAPEAKFPLPGNDWADQVKLESIRIGDSCPIPGTTKGRKTKGKTDQREKEGNFDTANEDFDSLNPKSVKNLPNGGRTGILSDGRKVNVRPHSTDGRPTIEIQKEKKKIKIRYVN